MTINVSDDGFFVNIHDEDTTLVVSKSNISKYKNDDGRWQSNNLGICIHLQIPNMEGKAAFKLIKSNIDSMEEAVMIAVDYIKHISAAQQLLLNNVNEEAANLKKFVKGLV